MMETRELHSRAMDFFEQGLLAARSGNNESSIRLFREALELEAAAANSVAGDHNLEPTRSILHRSASSIALRVGDAQTAKKYVEAGLSADPPAEIREELAILRHQILVYEAATRDYRRKAPGERTLIEQISRHFRSTAPVRIRDLANAFGLAVRQADLGPNIAGEIFRDLYRGGFSGYTIRVNSADSKRLQRLAVAHEIGHYLRHRNRIENKLVDDHMFRSRLGSTREKEAEDLAFDLLMPRALIREFRTAGMTDPEQLAARFNVPTHVMKRRLGIRD